MSSPFDYFEAFDNIRLRYGRWRCTESAVQGTVVLLGGRKDFMEKYRETIDELNDRGFDVYSLDWRGQGLSSRMLQECRKGFVRSYNHYIDDLVRFIEKIVKTDTIRPLIILSHSMGAHIALRYIHDHPGPIEKAVFVSPMFSILTSGFLMQAVRIISHLAVKFGLDHAYAFGARTYHRFDEKFEGNRLTSDPERFMDEKTAISRNPDLAVGGMTFGWLEATFQSIDILMKSDYCEKIKTPILIVSGGADKVVSLKAQKMVCGSLPNSRIKIISDSRHEILKENDGIRRIFWNEFDAFTGMQD